MCGWDDEFLLFLWEVSWKKQKTGDVDESRTKMEEWTGKITEKSLEECWTGYMCFFDAATCLTASL